MDIIPYNTWLNLCIDIGNLTEHCFESFPFNQIDSVSLSGSMSIRRIYSSFNPISDRDLYKLPKGLELSKNSIDIHSIFIDMEKLFGVESIINEQEEVSSDEDDNNYRQRFLEELKNQELEYIRKKVRDVAKSSEHYTDKFQSEYANSVYLNKMAKPMKNLTKNKIKKNRDKPHSPFSPYQETAKQLSRNTKLTQTQAKDNDSSQTRPSVKKGKSSNGVVPKGIAKLSGGKNNPHTSSIPSLPSVVRDSRFKENISKQDSFGLRKRLHQKDTRIEEIYQEIEENGGIIEPHLKSSIEIPYFARGNSYNNSQQNANLYSKYKFGGRREQNNSAKQGKKKRFQSAHVHNVKGIVGLQHDPSNKSNLNEQYLPTEKRNEFFARRKIYQARNKLSKLHFFYFIDNAS